MATATAPASGAAPANGGTQLETEHGQGPFARSNDHFAEKNRSKALHVKTVSFPDHARVVGVDGLYAGTKEYSVRVLDGRPGAERITRYFVEISFFLKVL